MAVYHFNVDKVIDKAKDIKGLTDVVWLFDLKKEDEIILEVSSFETSMLLLKVLLVIITEGILENNTSLYTKSNQNTIYSDIKVSDYPSLAKALTNITGIKFSVFIPQE